MYYIIIKIKYCIKVYKVLIKLILLILYIDILYII